MSKALIFNDTAVLSAAQKVALPMPFTAEILGATLQLNSAPAGSAATFDIEVAGVSILAAALSVAAGAVVPTTAASFQKNGTITGAVNGAGVTAVYTVATGHLFKVGDVVNVASVTVSAGSAVPYNFTGKQVSAVADRLVATVTVAAPLSAAQQKRLESALSASYGTELNLNVEIDPSILGGVKVQVSGEIIDGSVAARLNQAKLQLA